MTSNASDMAQYEFYQIVINSLNLVPTLLFYFM